MTNQHPITPSPELVQKWYSLPLSTEEIIAIAWRHGADQELDACCREIIDGVGRLCLDETGDRVCLAEEIQSARRPKPQSLAQEALDELYISDAECRLGKRSAATIRRALERLQQLENNQ